MKKAIVVVLLVLFSCTDKSLQSRIEDVDRIEVIDGKTEFSYTETRKELVLEFKKVFDGRPEPTDCTPQGTILFRKGDKTSLQVGYYKDASACNFLIIEDGGKKMGYRYSFNILVYLGEYFQKLKQEHNARHN